LLPRSFQHGGVPDHGDRVADSSRRSVRQGPLTGRTHMRNDKILYGLFFVGLCFMPLIGAYPVFVLKLLCFGLFACAFNLLIGFTGLLSFGHAAFFGGAGYICGHALQTCGLTPAFALLAGTVAGALL